ncbi:DNA/RNA non-specific endonuclease [Actinosynnema sp. ALI-1.44]|uniref:DNA/RNA non-specific endonuclease n=1 Tax=Actinosynnema sp. ALI-1.44 TaxID=1933779 RepID=UPI001EDB9186|nr:DNA/RNA non-specific endonuclease [Actinosynnema sp. ALI-1.44]
MIPRTASKLVVLLAAAIVLGPTHNATAAQPPPVATLPTPDVGDLGPRVLGGFLKTIPGLEAQVTSLQNRVVALQQRKEALVAEVQQQNGKIDAHNQKSAACDQKTSAWNTKAAAFTAKATALNAKIDAHNAKPHVFELPRQAAEARAYDAETNQLRSEQDALKAENAQLEGEKSQLAAERSAVDNEGRALETEKRQLRSRIDALKTEGEQLADVIQELLEQAMEELQSAMASQTQEVPRRTPGGDQDSPASRTGYIGNPADDGGDPVSRKQDSDALDSYAVDNSRLVDKRQVNAVLTPEAVSGLSVDQVTRLTPYQTYDGLVRKSTGTYTALAIRPTATEPGQQPFDEAIRRGGTATAVVDGKRIVIDAVDTIPAPTNSPTPTRPSVPTPAPQALKLATDMRQVTDNGRQAGTSTIPGHNGSGLPQGITMPRPWPGEDSPRAVPDHAPKPAPKRCTANWQDYGALEEIRVPDGFRYRATGAEACVVTVAGPGRPSLGFPLPGLRTDEGMARCHLIGHQLNGSDTDLRNFVPCYQEPTNNAWMSGLVESTIARRVTAGDPVYMVVRPLYATQDLLPVGIIVHAQSNAGWQCSTFVPNVTVLQASSGGFSFVGC